MAETNVQKLVRVLCTPFQDLEDTLQQLLTERSVETAIGEQLDVLGKIVGQDRIGLDDETYRRYIRAKIATNKSDGIVEDILTVVSLLVFDDDATYELTREGIATFTLQIHGVTISDALADIIIAFIRLAKSAGVRAILQSGDTPPEEWFAFDGEGPGLDDGQFIDARE